MEDDQGVRAQGRRMARAVEAERGMAPAALPRRHHRTSATSDVALLRRAAEAQNDLSLGRRVRGQERVDASSGRTASRAPRTGHRVWVATAGVACFTRSSHDRGQQVPPVRNLDAGMHRERGAGGRSGTETAGVAWLERCSIAGLLRRVETMCDDCGDGTGWVPGTVTVALLLRGANAQTVERRFVAPLELELCRVQGVDTVLGSASEGRGRVVVEPAPGVDLREEVRAAVERVQVRRTPGAVVEVSEDGDLS